MLTPLLVCHSYRRQSTSVILVVWPVPIITVFFQADEPQTTESINSFSLESSDLKQSDAGNLQYSMYVEQRVRCHGTGGEDQSVSSLWSICPGLTDECGY